MPKSNVLSGGMKVFFSLLLAFFYFWVYYFSFCASEEIILRKLVLQNSSGFWDVTRIISNHQFLQKFKYNRKYTNF